MHIYSSSFLPHSPARNADCLDDADHNLRHEDEEESHEVEGAVGPARRDRQVSGVMPRCRGQSILSEREGDSLEGLVNGPEPAHVGAGSEEDQPQEGHAEVGGAASATHPR